MKIFEYQEIDSTNEELKRLALQGVGQGTIVFAHRQNAGKGRLGRSWHSLEGNLFFSILLEKYSNPQHLPIIAAVGVFNSICHSSVCWNPEKNNHLTEKQNIMDPSIRWDDNKQLKIKWINDILLDGKKVAGILIERLIMGQEKSIIGVGVNISSYPTENMLYQATSLAEYDIKIDKKGLMQQIATNILAYCEVDFADIRDMWLKNSHKMGEEMHIMQNDEKIIGNYAGIDENGALLLDIQGEICKIMAGDVGMLC